MWKNLRSFQCLIFQKIERTWPLMFDFWKSLKEAQVPYVRLLKKSQRISDFLCLTSNKDSGTLVSFFRKCERISVDSYVWCLKEFEITSGFLCLIPEKVWKNFIRPSVSFLGNVKESLNLLILDIWKSLKESRVLYVWFVTKFERVSAFF